MPLMLSKVLCMMLDLILRLLEAILAVITLLKELGIVDAYFIPIGLFISAFMSGFAFCMARVACPQRRTINSQSVEIVHLHCFLLHVDDALSDIGSHVYMDDELALSVEQLRDQIASLTDQSNYTELMDKLMTLEDKDTF